MKLHRYHCLTKALPIFRKIFPATLLQEMETECLPKGNYRRLAAPRHLAEAMLKAIILRLPSQSEIVNQCPNLGLSGHSSLGYDLDRPWFAAMAAQMNDYCAQQYPSYDCGICKHPRKLLDTMPALIQITQRGACSKFNNVAKGCGVMASFNLDAGQGQSLADILKIMPGGWNDTYQVRDVPLAADGPLYIADRGFYSLETTQLWRSRGVHFILRAKKHNLRYSVISSAQVAQDPIGLVRIESDEIVMLGKENSKYRSQVRLLKGWLYSKDSVEDLWLVSDQFGLTAEQLLDNYFQRGTIEVYHRFVKQSLGAAHLYSFDQHGIQSQIHLTVLLANLLFIAACDEQRKDRKPMDILTQMLGHVRSLLGVIQPWKRNTVAQRRAKPLHNRRHLKRRSTALQHGANL